MIKKKYLVLTETPYQQRVIRGCANIADHKNIHWRVRGELPPDANTLTVTTRLSFLIQMLLNLPRFDALILGDFRSLIQILAVVFARGLGKQVILSEDGLVNLVADYYNYKPECIADGGLRPFKLALLRWNRKTFRTASRITTQPLFLESIGKYDYLTAQTSLANVSSETRPTESKKLIFVGQHLSPVGVSVDTQLFVLEQLKNQFEETYSELLYSIHPRSNGIAEAIQKKGWKIMGALDDIKERPNEFDLVGFHSTALLDPKYASVRKYLIPLAGKFSYENSNVRGQLRAQEVLIKVLQSQNALTSLLPI